VVLPERSYDEERPDFTTDPTAGGAHDDSELRRRVVWRFAPAVGAAGPSEIQLGREQHPGLAYSSTELWVTVWPQVLLTAMVTGSTERWV